MIDPNETSSVSIVVIFKNYIMMCVMLTDERLAPESSKPAFLKIILLHFINNSLSNTYL